MDNFDTQQALLDIQQIHQLAVDAGKEGRYLTKARLLERAVSMAKEIDDLPLLIKERYELALAQEMISKDVLAIATHSWLIGLAHDPKSKALFADEEVLQVFAGAYTRFVGCRRELPNVPIEGLLQVVADGQAWLTSLGRSNLADGLRMEKGLLLRTQDNNEDARQELESALALARRNPEMRCYSLATYQLALADLLSDYSFKLYNEALALVDSVLAEHENNPYSNVRALRVRADILLQLSQHEEALRTAQEALHLAKQLIEVPFLEIQVLILLGEIYLVKLPLREAERMFREALELREKLGGSGQPDLTRILNYLGLAYQSQGRHEEADQLFQQAMSTQEQQQDTDRLDSARSLNNLGLSHFYRGNYQKADELLQLALTEYEQLPQAEQVASALSFNNLGVLLLHKGQYVEAEEALLRALAIYERYGMAEHPHLALGQTNLGVSCIMQNKLKEAEQSLKRALAIYEQHRMTEHPNAVLCLANQGLLYMKQRKYEEAEKALHQALTIYEQQKIDDHPNIARILSQLALISLRQKDKATAEILFERAETLCQGVVQVREQKLGSDHLETASALYDLAQLYASEEKNAKARSLYVRVLEIRQQKLGSDHLDLTYPLLSLGETYETGFWSAFATPLYQRALEIREKQLGLNNSSTRFAQKKYLEQKRLMRNIYIVVYNALVLLLIAGLIIWFFHAHDLLGWIALGFAILSGLRLVLEGSLFAWARLKVLSELRTQKRERKQ